jgi:hypothetical protein
MNPGNGSDKRLGETYEFLAKVLGTRAQHLAAAAQLPDIPPDLPEGVIPKWKLGQAV